MHVYKNKLPAPRSAVKPLTPVDRIVKPVAAVRAANATAWFGLKAYDGDINLVIFTITKSDIYVQK